MFYADSYDDSQAEYWWRRAEWNPAICLLPRRSDYSGKWIWGPGCVRGVKIIHGPGDDVVLEFWMTNTEFMMFRLTDGD